MASAKSKIQKLKAKDYGFKPFQKMPGSQSKHFSKFHDSMFDAPAWIDMSIHSKYLYIEISRKFNGANENNIMFTQREGIQIMGKNTFARCIKELIGHGFLEYVERNTYNCLANIYGFSAKWHTFVPTEKLKKPSS